MSYYHLVRYASVFSGSSLLSPGADVQPFPGSWLAGWLPVGHLDTEICQRQLLTVIPPRYIPATLRKK